MAKRMQHLTCQACGSDWTRPAVRGQRPKWCTDCKADCGAVGEGICEWCGHSPIRRDARTCSRTCGGNLVRYSNSQTTSPLPWRSCTQCRTVTYSDSDCCDPPPPPSVDTPTTWYAGYCVHCGDPFTLAWQPGTFCSHRCLTAHHKARRRARLHDAYVAPVSRSKIHRRDGWRCHICRALIPPRYRDPAITRNYPNGDLPELAPVLDHIIPLAAGGTHEPRNVATAHNICNHRKGAGTVSEGEQLRII